MTAPEQDGPRLPARFAPVVAVVLWVAFPALAVCGAISASVAQYPREGNAMFLGFGAMAIADCVLAILASVAAGREHERLRAERDSQPPSN